MIIGIFMEKTLERKRNPVYIAGGISIIILIITGLLFYFNLYSNLQTYGIVALIISGGITFIFYQNQCQNCKRVFTLKRVSDEVIKEWEEPKQYNEKTIYYYSDGITQKDVKNGATKTFTARFERHKDGFNCKKCGENHYKERDVFLNKNDWLRVTAPNKVTTSTNKPQQHHTNMNFDLNSFEPTYYTDKKGTRKSIPTSVKKKLWIDYNGKKYKGACFVCKEIIDINNFEAGHVIPASQNGSDNIRNLRPICKSCNRSMGNMNLNDFKQRYH